jgi:hypothetical protein
MQRIGKTHIKPAKCEQQEADPEKKLLGQSNARNTPDADVEYVRDQGEHVDE